LASVAICLIVAVSFGIFAINQTTTASQHQQELVGTAEPASGSHVTHQSALHKTIDHAARDLTSPFSGLITTGSGEWADRGVKLLLSLLVYGFGLGYLARVLRVRV
jgi:hypothetical protein